MARRMEAVTRPLADVPRIADALWRFREIVAIVNRNALLAPQTQGRAFMTMQYYCDFEGHGHASETWEPHYVLVFHGIGAYTKNYAPRMPQSKKWIPVAKAKWKDMRFHGRTWVDVIEQAHEFITWWDKYGSKPWVDTNANHV